MPLPAEHTALLVENASSSPWLEDSSPTVPHVLVLPGGSRDEAGCNNAGPHLVAIDGDSLGGGGGRRARRSVGDQELGEVRRQLVAIAHLRHSAQRMKTNSNTESG